jgi:short subunit dehydrogenase-like uncharacterized protein
MSREFDIVIFGASGFVGKYAIQNLHESAKKEGLRWAVAGRNQEKVREAIHYASDLCGQGLSDVPIIVADVSDYDSLVAMTRRTSVVVNCVGPYTLYGEPVVKACIESGTHHVDVTGEVNWLENMHIKYDAKAREAKSLIVGACAYESLPSEVSVNWMREQFDAKGWTLNAVQEYMKIIPGKEGLVINTGTWNSAIGFVGKFFEFRKTQNILYGQFFSKKLPNYKYTTPSGLPLHPKVSEKTQVPVYEIDSMISKRTNTMNYNLRNERPVYVAKYMTVKSLWHVAAFAFFILTFGPLFLFSAGRKLLMRYPRFFSYGFFSEKGPTRTQVATTRFQFIIRGSGWNEKLAVPVDQQPNRPPDVQLYGTVNGPEPTYPTTSQCAVQAAVTLVRDQLPIDGGVVTPGFAFRNTNILNRLNNAPVNPIKFQLIEQ